VKNLFNFFFSFDKLLKEKLIIPFFWLAIVSWGLTFFSTALDSIHLAPIAALARDADGNLLKKDGTPRKRPGPKT